MTTSITQDATTWTPQGWDTFEMSGEAGTRVHPILGRSNPDVTFGVGSLSTGTLGPKFEGETAEVDSLALYLALRAGGVFMLTSDEATSTAMSFVPVGRFTRTLEDETRAAWLVTFDVQEVESE